MALVSGLYRLEPPTERYENKQEGERRIRRALQRLVMIHGQDEVVRRITTAQVREDQREMRQWLAMLAMVTKPGQRGGSF